MRSKSWREARGNRNWKSPVVRLRPPKTRCSRGAQWRSESSAREQEPGYYLISKGRRAIEKEIGFRVPMSEWLVRANAAVGILGYVGAIAIIGAFILAAAAARRGGSSASADGRSLCSRFSAWPRRRMRRWRWSTAASQVRSDARTLPAHGASRRSAREPAHDGRCADAFDDASGDSKSRSSAWKCTTWRARTAIFASRCSRTGPTPPPMTRRMMTRFSARPPLASRG